MFTIMDGSMAMDVINYLTQQEHLSMLEVDGKKYHGIHANKAKDDSKKETNEEL